MSNKSVNFKFLTKHSKREKKLQAPSNSGWFIDVNIIWQTVIFVLEIFNNGIIMQIMLHEHDLHDKFFIDKNFSINNLLNVCF